MKGGGGLLAAAVTAVWALVYGFTHTFAEPPLDVRWTLLVGVSLSVLLILGYPSALRGPRQPLRASPRPPVRGPARSSQDRTIEVVGRTAPYLRRGLTAETAGRTAELLRPILYGDAVAFTDRSKVLAFVGPGADHHGPGSGLLTAATERVLASGRTAVVRNRHRLGCRVEGCPLHAAVVAPLKVRGEVVGALKVYRVEDEPPPPHLVTGMAGILSMHLELAELERQSQLAADARLESLRAQINPHFLFNTLNTITSKARTDPEEARQLLLRLSDFFRYSIRHDGQFADFAQEYFFVRTYLALEQARFEDRLRVRYDVDPQVLGAQVPVLMIQPLVENAVKHGLAPKVGGGTVTLRARVDPLARAVSIQVRDDGVGIDDDTLVGLLDGRGDGDGSGIGLRNISERLGSLFGNRYKMDVKSQPRGGTTVNLRIPLR
jgi:LytS/YehU family sensor histidine kinase